MRPFVRSAVAFCFLTALATSGEAATISVNAGDNLQGALNAAEPGDTILVQPGATFTGNFVLPAKPGATFITIRSAAADADLPAAGVRMGPEWSSKVPKLRSGNSAAALRTAPGAHHWRVMLIEFLPNVDGLGDIIQIGDGSSAQKTLAQVPNDIELDRVYVHGDPGMTQKRGIALNGGRVTIQNSYVAECKGVNMDAQAIAGWNGPGPYTIENNYLEGAAENFLLGGSDPAIPGLVATSVVFRRNYLAKPLAWRNPIVPAPATLTASTSAGGTLSAGSISYLVVARRSIGMGMTARSNIVSTSAAPPAGGSVRLQWAMVPGAADYQVFARGYQWTVTGTTFTDTGAPGTTAAAPAGEGTKWVVKNLFELKNARSVTVQYNVFESNWQAGQAGYAIVLTPRNSGGLCTWCTIEDVEFSYNIVRHTAAAINILGHDSPQVSGVTTNIRIRNNLFYDISKNWGGNGWFLQIGDGPQSILVDHNTIDHDGSSIVYAYGGTAASPAVVRGFQFTNNIARHGTYGLSGAFFAYGTALIDGYFPGATVKGNLLSGGTASRYPAGNFFNSDFAAQFTGLLDGDYRLASSSVGIGTATDGTNLGADAASIVAATAPVGGGVILASSAPRGPGGLRFVPR